MNGYHKTGDFKFNYENLQNDKAYKVENKRNSEIVSITTTVDDGGGISIFQYVPFRMLHHQHGVGIGGNFFSDAFFTMNAGKINTLRTKVWLR